MRILEDHFYFKLLFNKIFLYHTTYNYIVIVFFYISISIFLIIFVFTVDHYYNSKYYLFLCKKNDISF